MKEVHKPSLEVNAETLVFKKSDGTHLELSLIDDILEPQDIKSMLLWCCFMKLSEISAVLKSMGAQDADRNKMIGALVKHADENSGAVDKINQTILDSMSPGALKGVKDHVNETVEAVAGRLAGVPGMPDLSSLMNDSRTSVAVDNGESGGES